MPYPMKRYGYHIAGRMTDSSNLNNPQSAVHYQAYSEVTLRANIIPKILHTCYIGWSLDLIRQAARSRN